MSVAFTIQRRILVAGEITAIVPPYPATMVKIGNATPDDLRVLSQSGDATQYSVIAAGFEETFDGAGRNLFGGSPAGTVAFYLNAVGGGPITLKWF